MTEINIPRAVDTSRECLVYDELISFIEIICEGPNVRNQISVKIMKAKLKTFKLLSISLSLAAALAACNLPGRSSSTSPTASQGQVGSAPTVTVPVNPTQTQIAVVPGTSTVPLVTASPSSPNAPLWSVYHYTCELAAGGGTMTMNLGWTDRSNNEEGFNIYRDGLVIATLAPDSTSFTDVAFVATGKALKYSVEAFNKDWRGSTSTITNFCQ